MTGTGRTGTGMTSGVRLYWLPLGAGGHSVRWNGRIFEALVARHEHRTRCDLYHSALEVTLDDEVVVIEMAPVWSGDTDDHAGVVVGPVGARLLGRSALFRYEVRRWHGGTIPDADEAVESPVALPYDAARARLLLDLVPEVPALTWGRDELHLGEMWNSNSVVSWLLARTGHPVHELAPPAGGRAPGWHAGLALAALPDHP